MSEVKTKTEKTIDFYEFLKNIGYKIPNREEIVARQGYGIDYALPVSSSNDTTVGTIYKTSDNPVEHGRIEIIYYLNASQVNEALLLKEFLDRNNIKYKEVGDKKVIAQKFRESADELKYVADRLEGKV